MELETLEDLRKAVEDSDGILTVSMRDVRDAYGVKKLGVHVRAGISKALRGQGLAHYPPELPEYQEESLRVYKQGTRVADLVNAVLTPSADTDEQLREWVGGEADDVLDKIRELVC